ncbi:uncharacterized protein BDR25DRAFT_339639 [Lindgomyces ingoldianus]|uniref:Uncharacterized protein n=1 Tax=Lindgomyces ingoldianus TaxID=673940 RepID=A0ACB6REI4_9PLEO|nr:uncharacterized protein BDR25DRAFT_339639 [Lindgomyces ingoldianus]KAF2476737.1 hypothetical protein BDR25DRAFT_339639 [Lindgomyces ingoldianus]
MLDPVSAVGVAAATVQFVDFSTKLFAVGKELRGSLTGQTAERIQLDEVYSHLKTISTKLSQSTRPPTATIPSQEEQDLYRLAGLCQQECDLFLVKIDKVNRKSSSQRTFNTFRDALKLVWSQKAIDGLEKRLERYQRELTLALINHLGNGQSSIVRGLQTLIADNRRLESSQKRQIDDITDLLIGIQKEQDSQRNRFGQSGAPSTSHIGYVTMKIPWAFHVASQMILQQRFLSSLYFQSLKLRHSRIENAHDRTFKWLFQKPGLKQRGSDPKMRFLNWLRSGQGIFWVSGKPGSGKSTLMKYINSNPRTEEVLFEWANPRTIENPPKKHDSPPNMTFFSRRVDDESDDASDESEEVSNTQEHTQDAGGDFDEEIRVVVASFYFWSAGTSMQKSQQGLFQSLLYEIFSHAPDLMKQACPIRWQAAEVGESQEPWTIEEISDTIKRTIGLATDSIKFCFFVDGVDEYIGDHFEMVRVLESFARLPNVKICVSSRPWNVFEDAFGKDSDQKFYLQDLTRGDIDRYVRSKLKQHPAWKTLTHDDERYKAIATEIIEKAQGVFLWVFLVVRSLLEGLSNGDTLSLLQERLRRIPTDLRDFFKYMLDSLDPIYNQHVAHFFLAALDSDPLPLMMYAYFEEEFDDPNYVFELNNTQMETYDIIPRHKQTERRLNGRCKGLLEANREEGVDFFRYSVGFLHRTVRDFFLTLEMREEFERRLPSSLQICVSMAKSSLALIKKSPRVGEVVGKSSSFRYLLDLTLYSSRRAELSNGAPTTKILDELSYVLKDLNFYESYWSGTKERGGDTRDMFLALTLERGLLLYTSQQLEYRSRNPISTRRLNLGGEQSWSLLDCALTLPRSESFDEPDVSDMVLYLLTNGCNPNELHNNKTPFSRFLQRMGLEQMNENAGAETSVYSHRLTVLKHLLTHGGDPNFGASEGSWATWVTFFRRLYEQDVPKKHCQHFIDIIELLLSFGADPNRPAEGVCRCCRTFTPWRHFLTWRGGLKGIKAAPFHQQEFLARVCTLLLEHGADPTITFPQSKNSWVVAKTASAVNLPGLSVADIIRTDFPARLAAPVLAALPIEAKTSNQNQCGIRGPGSTPSPGGTYSESIARPSTISLWNPLSWLSYFRQPPPPAKEAHIQSLDLFTRVSDDIAFTDLDPASASQNPALAITLRKMGFTCSSSALPKSFLLAAQNRFTTAELRGHRRAEVRSPIFLFGAHLFPGITMRCMSNDNSYPHRYLEPSSALREISRRMTPATLNRYECRAMRNTPWPALISSGLGTSTTGMLLFTQDRSLQFENMFEFEMIFDKDWAQVDIETADGEKESIIAQIHVYKGVWNDLVPVEERRWDPSRLLTERRLKNAFDRVRELEHDM